MAFFGGIDGGQSSTQAAVCDARGRILGRAAGPPADLVGEGPGSLRQRLAVEGALHRALEAAGLVPATRLAALVIGLTGHDAGMPAPWPATEHDAVRFVHDTEIAHAGALGGNPGIVVLAGTGSVALGNDRGGGFVRSGGWGYVFGDEGGAFWIGRRALAAAMASEDRGRPSPFTGPALAHFDVPDLRGVQHAVARSESTRPRVAAFAAAALELAGPEAERLCESAAAALAELAAVVDARLGRGTSRRVSFAGGVFGSDRLTAAFARHLKRRLPEAELVAPAGSPLDGALLLAQNLAHESDTGRTVAR